MTDEPLGDDPYETLGVARDATASKITRAWRRRTKGLRPGTPELAAVNDAAALLLDPVRRPTYDAEFARRRLAAAEAATEPEAGPETTDEPADQQIPMPEKARAARWTHVLSGWTGTAAIAGVIALIAVALAVWQGIDYANRAGAGPFAAPTSDQQAALGTAQTGLAAVLSYDYRSMQRGVANAERFMTARERKDFAKTIDRIIDGGTIPGTTQTLAPVAQRKAIVVATVLSAGVVSATSTTAQIGAFVDQTTTQTGSKVTHQNWVQVAMVKQGGSWLIDGMCVPQSGMVCAP